MKLFKNNLDNSGNLFQIKALSILHALIPVMNAYDNVILSKYSSGYFIMERTQLRHARRELFNIFNSLTGCT